MTTHNVPFERPAVRTIFPTNILETRIHDSERLNAALKSAVQSRKATDPGIARSNILGWHSDTEMLKWGGEPVRYLALAALQLCSGYTHDRAMRAGDPPRFEMGLEMWANVSPPGASNQVHAHPGCVWSAVYYVDDGGDPSGGPLVLHDPRFPMNRMTAPDLVFAVDGVQEESRVEIEPTPGKLVAFPSWLMHGVKPHQGTHDRISIAINIMALPVRPERRGAQ